MDERFWYNCKQGLDCSQGDIQVISRRWVMKFSRNLIDVSLYFRSRKKLERISSRVGSLRMNFELGKMCQSCLQVTGISSLSGRFR